MAGAQDGYKTIGSTKLEVPTSKALGGQGRACKITESCMELLGPEGLFEENPRKVVRDARIFDIFEGAGDV